MSQIPKVFRRFVPQLLHMVVLPIFFFTFMLVYRPFDISSFLGDDWFGVHLTIISCIILLSVTVARLVYYFLPMKMNYSLYIFWCLTETVFASFFVALYIWLVLNRPMLYFEVLTRSFKYLFFTLLIPYTILSLSLLVYDCYLKSLEPEDHNTQRMRFYDNMHNLKIVLMPQAVLYIAAEENYVSIYYLCTEKLDEGSG